MSREFFPGDRVRNMAGEEGVVEAFHQPDDNAPYLMVRLHDGRQTYGPAGYWERLPNTMEKLTA